MLGKIAAIGIEIEGPWTDTIPINGFVADFHDEYMPHPMTDRPVMFKECVSVPLKNEAQVKAFFDQVRNQWYDKGIVDGMGMHIHFSFKDPKWYDLLLSPKFVASLKLQLFEDFKDDERLQRRPAYRSQAGSNFYKMEYPDEYWKRSPKRLPQDGNQADGRKNRYYIVNYWRAYEAHKTYEIRIYPSNTIKRMKEYVQWTIDFINNYCEARAPESNCNIKKDIHKKQEKRIINVSCRQDPKEELTLNPPIPRKQKINSSTGGL